MKKICLILFTFIFAASFSGCSQKLKEKDTLKAQEALESFLDDYKNKKFDELNEYAENSSCEIPDLYKADSAESNLIFNTITDKLTYKINSTKTDNDSMIINITVSNIDMAEIMSASLGEYLANGEGKPDDYLSELIQKNIEVNIDKINTDTFELVMVKQDKKWVISESQTAADFYNAVTGRYYSYTIGTSQAFSMMTDIPQ